MTEAATSAPAESAAPAMPETFSSVRDAARFLTAERAAGDAPPAKAKTESPPDADAVDGAPGELELSDEDNAALGEDQAHGEDQDADPEGEDLPPIARPKSWGKEDQAEWESLSRSQQEKIAAREETREKAIRKAQNDAAEEAKAHKAKGESAEKAKSDYEQKARNALDILAREQQRDFADIKTAQDVSNMAKTDPLRFVQWQAHQAELAAIKDAVDAADKAKADKESEDWKQFRATEDKKAIEYVPELGDKEKAPKLMQKAVALLQEIGFTPAELGKLDKGERLSLFDHRIQRVLVDAIRYQDIQNARKAAATKAVPAVARPGGRQPQGNAASERIKALTAAFNNNPTLKNAAALQTAERNARARRAS